MKRTKKQIENKTRVIRLPGFGNGFTYFAYIDGIYFSGSSKSRVFANEKGEKCICNHIDDKQDFIDAVKNYTPLQRYF